MKPKVFMCRLIACESRQDLHLILPKYTMLVYFLESNLDDLMLMIQELGKSEIPKLYDEKTMI